MRSWFKKFAIVGATLATMPVFQAGATTGFSHGYNRPVTLTLNAKATGCDNRGSTVEISGALALAEVGVKMTLKNNVIGTHTWETIADASLTIDPVGTLIIPKQPVRGGVGGNPRIWVRFLDDTGSPLTGYYYIGRCVQGTTLKTLQISLSVPAVARAFFSALECSNRRTNITIDSSSETSGVNAQVVFTNNAKWTHEVGPYDAVAGATLASPIVAPKQGALGGAGGNPLVFGNFVLKGANLTDPIKLGRCNKL